MAGTGKSTIARTVAHEFSRGKHLGGSFFFVRGGGDVSHAGMLFTSIAVQLAIRQPHVKQHLVEAVQQEPGIASKSRMEQWKQLIAQPLQKTTAQTLPPVVVLVIDALDECDNDKDMKGLVAVLAHAREVTAVKLRVIVTSRPETPIRLGFKKMPEILHRDLLLHEVPREIVDADICLFFYDQLGEVKDMYGLPEEWPGVDHINQLVSVSAGLFIFAATVCRFVQENEMSAEDALSLFLPHSKSRNNDEGRGETTQFLDAMYSHILHRSRTPAAPKTVAGKSHSPAEETLAAIAALSEPLPIGPLAKLLHVRPSDVTQHLSRFHSIVRIPEAAELPIRLFHASLRDFLFDAQRSSGSGFWIDQAGTHGRLADCCLRLLNESTTFASDICGVVAPGTRWAEVSAQDVAHHIPPDVAYACSYWPWHLANSRERLCDNGEVHLFLQEHLLHWLETLSWLGRLSSAIGHISDLLSLAQENHSREVVLFLQDAKRFVLKHRFVVDLAPLQIYHSALIFTPTRSVVRDAFYRRTPSLWARLPDMPMHWGAEILKLEGHDGSVMGVAFSPDGQVVASASDDKTVRLWNAQTGEEIQKLEHDDWVIGVAFSPDGQVVASASGPTVGLWNAQTGEETQRLEGHDEWVTAVAFSPDGQVVVSASEDKTVRLWNAQTGEQTQKLAGHDNWVTAVAFSPDGQVVVSASEDKTVRLWKAQTGEEIQRLKGHDNAVIGVAVSPKDGQVIASASIDKTVRLWNAQTGEQMQKLEGQTQKLKGHDNRVTEVVFSPDGQIVASASWDRTVWLWNAQTGEQTGLVADVDGSYRIAFSTDGRSLLTATGTYVLANPPQNLQEHNSTRTASLELNGQWILSQGEDILWLPHEYRGFCSATHGQMLAIGQASGAVSFFQLK